MTSRSGRVFLVGAGPGAPDLITVRGAELIRSADVIVYDNLVAYATLRLAREDAELIFAGKKGGGSGNVPQAEINRILIEQARRGRRVVRLKGGDPFIFGRGGEEAEALRAAGIDYEVVPGVTSAIAVPAFAGIPLTHREHRVIRDNSDGSSGSGEGRRGSGSVDVPGAGGEGTWNDRDADGDGAAARQSGSFDEGRGCLLRPRRRRFNGEPQRVSAR